MSGCAGYGREPPCAEAEGCNHRCVCGAGLAALDRIGLGTRANSNWRGAGNHQPSPVFEQATARDHDALSFCLGKNYSGRLTLNRANSPPQPPQITRFRNRTLHMVVDFSAQGANGSMVRVFNFNDTPLAIIHRLGSKAASSENGLPAVADPLRPAANLDRLVVQER